MTSPRYARLAARALTLGLSPEDDGEPPPQTVARVARSSAIDAIEEALREKARRRVRGRWSAGVAAAAALVAVAGGAAHFAHLTIRAQTAGAAPVVVTNGAPLAGESGEGPSASSSAQGLAADRAGGPMVVGHATGGVTVTAPGSSATVADGKPLAAGSRVIAPAGGRALLAFSTGTQLTVEEGSDMTIVEEGATQVFALAGGALRAKVAKLSDDQRFLVRTADAEVEVRGTSFRVAVAPSDPACGGGTTTRVAVYEGQVVVRSDGAEARVVKGESWPSHCAAADRGHGRSHGGALSASMASGAEARAEEVGITAAERGAAHTTRGRTHAEAGATGRTAALGGTTASTRALAEGASVAGNGTPSSASPVGASAAITGASMASAPPGSSLAIQNDRFAAAIAAKQSGDVPTAIAGFERFLSAYPGSPLAESAIVERMKLLAVSDAARGASAARQYLARYPGGFARAEAEAIAAERR